MWEFLDRLISLAIPRIRDFRGLPANSCDGRGNYTFGVNEQLIFPEIDYDQVDTTRGMDITIVTTAPTTPAGKALLDAFGFPFKTGEDAQAPVDQPRKSRPVPWRPSAARGSKRQMAKKALIEKAAAQAEVQGPRPTPAAGAAAGPLGVPQVRALPGVPARARPRRRDPRRDEGQLVREETPT